MARLFLLAGLILAGPILAGPILAPARSASLDPPPSPTVVYCDLVVIGGAEPGP